MALLCREVSTPPFVEFSTYPSSFPPTHPSPPPCRPPDRECQTFHSRLRSSHESSAHYAAQHCKHLLSPVNVESTRFSGSVSFALTLKKDTCLKVNYCTWNWGSHWQESRSRKISRRNDSLISRSLEKTGFTFFFLFSIFKTFRKKLYFSSWFVRFL